MICRALRVCNDDLSAAICYYGERYPNRRIPDRRTIQRVERSLLECGFFASFHRNYGRIRKLIEVLEVLTIILELVRHHCLISITFIVYKYYTRYISFEGS